MIGIIFEKENINTLDAKGEVLLTLSGFGKETAKVDNDWEAVSEPYVIKYKAKITDFEYYTFYEGQEEFLQDYHNRWIGLKKLLLQRAVDSSFLELYSDIYAYMKLGRIIEPERIIDCIPAEKWQEGISKYYK